MIPMHGNCIYEKGVHGLSWPPSLGCGASLKGAGLHPCPLAGQASCERPLAAMGMPPEPHLSTLRSDRPNKMCWVMTGDAGDDIFGRGASRKCPVLELGVRADGARPPWIRCKRGHAARAPWPDPAHELHI